MFTFPKQHTAISKRRELFVKMAALQLFRAVLRTLGSKGKDDALITLLEQERTEGSM